MTTIRHRGYVSFEYTRIVDAFLWKNRKKKKVLREFLIWYVDDSGIRYSLSLSVCLFADVCGRRRRQVSWFTQQITDVCKDASYTFANTKTSAF